VVRFDVAERVPTVAVAIVQAHVASSLAEGLETTRALTAEASAQGATLVVFPETWLPGYPAWLDVCRDIALWDHEPTKRVFARYRAESVDVDGASGAALADIARATGVTLVLGVSERVASGPGSGTLYNTMLTYGPDGQVLNHHRKLVPTYTERLVWGRGDSEGLHGVDTPGGRVGGLVCWEHWMPLARQALHVSGEDIHIAAWPTVHERHQIASRHYALEGRCFVLAAGSLMRASALPPDLERDATRAPSDDTLVLRGGSAIIGPDGTYLAAPCFDEPVILTATLDFARLDAERMTLDVAGHSSRPDAFMFGVTPAPQRSK
jgi:predicted amidohydrolase